MAPALRAARSAATLARSRAAALLSCAAALPAVAAAAAAAPTVVTASGAARSVPLLGLGGEFIFQSVEDDQLNAALVAAASRASRFPGGTPADYFDWRSGWMLSPTGPGCGGCDAVPWRPTPPDKLAAYLAETGQRAVFVLNQLTSSLDHQLEGVAAHAAAGSDVSLVELGNEMFDATRADVLAAYPRPLDYALKMANWTAALKAQFPRSKVAWVGLANDWDNRTRAWNGEVMPVAAQAGADAATIHLYPGLPNLNLSQPANFPTLLAGLFPLLDEYAAYTDASIPAGVRELWATEWGTWGDTMVETTWLQGLWHAAFAAQLPTRLPRLSVLAPYCAVCGDPAMPSFTTESGAVVPPNTTLQPGAWRRTASGLGYATVFSALNAPGATAMQALAFAPNAPLDPGVPASRQLVGARALDASGGVIALVLANLGAQGAALNLSAALAGAGAGCAARCAATYSPRNVTDAARQGLRVEELLRTEATVNDGGGALALPAYSLAVVSCGACAPERRKELAMPTRHAEAAFPPDTLAVRAPAVPLVVVDPFFSQWSPADALADAYTRHWTMIFGGGFKAMSALVRIDGAAYRLLGPECPQGATPALPQLGFARVYASSTVASFAGAGVELNLTFTQPIFGDGDARGEGLPLSYIVFDARSADGKPHSVQAYFDATAQLANNIDKQEVEWARVPLASPGSAALRLGTASQQRFDVNGDDARIDWGYVALAGINVTAAAASSNRMRFFFTQNGTLPADETVMPVPTCPAANDFICSCVVPGGAGALNDWPALALAWDLGAVSGDGGASTAFGVIAYDDLELGAARFFGVPQTAFWRSLGRSFAGLLDDSLQRFDAVMAASVAGDLDALLQLRAAGLGEAYERLCSLSFRQILGANKLAHYGGEFGPASLPEMHMWVKGMGSSGDTGTLDDNLPAVPFFLWARPHLVPAFLAPLFMWANNETFAGPDAPFPRNMTFDEAFAPHYLGQFPDAELQCWDWTNPENHCEQMPVEMSASALQIVAAHARQTDDYSFAERFWPLLERWAAFLETPAGLFPGAQRSSDDYEGFIVNSTHLAAKAVVALGSFSQLCNATGRTDAGAASWATALRMRDEWLVLARDGDGDHYALSYGAANSSSVKYSFLFDAALGLDLFAAPAAAECAFLASSPTTARPFGWVLQHRSGDNNSMTNLGWLGFMLAVCPAQAPLLTQQLLAFVNATLPRFPLTDLYDAGTAAFVGFSGRAQAGGLFAPVWLQGLRGLVR